MATYKELMEAIKQLKDEGEPLLDQSVFEKKVLDRVEQNKKAKAKASSSKRKVSKNTNNQ